MKKTEKTPELETQALAQAPELTEAQELSRNEKIHFTKKKKSEEAYELTEAPFVTETTPSGFSFFPVNGVRIVNGVDAYDVARIDDATLARLLTDEERERSAFALIKDKAGRVRFVPTLSRFESAVTVALLAEFVDQSRTFYDRVNEIKKIREQNAQNEAENAKIEKQNERVRKWNKQHGEDEQRPELALLPVQDVPRAYVGQDGDYLDDQLKKEMLNRWNVRAFEAYTDTKTLEVLLPVEKNGEVKGFKGKDDKLLLPKSFEVVRGVKTWHCEIIESAKAEERGECVDVIKWKGDKFVFLNLSKFWRKYFKQDLKSDEYKRAVSVILNLGTKRVPCFKEDGKFSNSQFFTTYFDAFRFGHDFYALLKLDAVEVFAGTETADNYLKLTEDVERILSDVSDVEIRLWLAAVNWKTGVYKQRKRLKGVRTMNKTCQELFEEFASLSELEQRRFARFWPKFRTAALKLQKEHVFLFFDVDGRPMTETTDATPEAKVTFGVNLYMNERRPPELHA